MVILNNYPRIFLKKSSCFTMFQSFSENFQKILFLYPNLPVLAAIIFL